MPQFDKIIPLTRMPASDSWYGQLSVPPYLYEAWFDVAVTYFTVRIFLKRTQGGSSFSDERYAFALASPPPTYYYCDYWDSKIGWLVPSYASFTF